jgi:D-serine deaminase-like pyridoxal phosphate-dependent protein
MQAMNRRRWLGLTALAGGAAWGLRPSDAGEPHNAFFKRLSVALRHAGLAQPTLVIDRERLHSNANRVRANLDRGLSLRLVNKSLPCLPLLDEVGRLTGTRQQMVFSQAHLQLLAEQRPSSDVLLGKPLPVSAAAQALSRATRSGLDVARQVQWLIDTPARLAQYRDLARGQQANLRINIEIDVGLHRGGVQDAATMQQVIALLREEPRLRWSGLMGYDAHTEKIPDIAGSRVKARAHVLNSYREHLAALHASGLNSERLALTLNTGGSPTYRLHRADGPANEVAVGSALVKPSDFETPLLADLLPAAWIATPLLKVQAFQAPYGVEALGLAAQWWDGNQRIAHFIHGGNWLARVESPAGLKVSGLIGHSSNQQLLLGSGRQSLKPDDHVFLRPTQSEAVLQQFGDIAVVEGDRVVAMWPVFPARG